ncbi:MAG: blaR1 8 [Planctomycetaceae bacterium]|nr:blaR1 8 [Planctomycetaceae bacterium]
MNQFLSDAGLLSLSVWLTVALLHFLWQGLLWAIVAAGLSNAMSRSSAQSRYLVHVTVLAGMTVGFISTLWLGCPTFNALPAQGLTAADPSEVREPVTTTPVNDRDFIAQPVSIDLVRDDSEHDTVALSSRAVSAASTRPLEREIRISSDSSSLLSLIAPYTTMFYLSGLLLMGARLLLGVCGSHWLARKSQRVADSQLQRILDEQVLRMGLKLAPVLTWCQRVSVPVVVGVFKPTILLPISLGTGLSADEISAILAHELAHIRRCDLIVNLFQRIVEAVLFFHPAVWYVSHCIRVERENCCDDCVVSAGWQRLAYAAALLRMAELCAWQRGLSINLAGIAATGSNSSEFKRRILRLLSVPADAAIPVSWTGVLILVIVGILGASTFLSARQVAPKESTASSEAEPDAKTVVAGGSAQSDASDKNSDAEPKRGPQSQQPGDQPKNAETLTATVVNADGTPAPNIEVSGYYIDGRLIKNFRTDAKGQIQVPLSWSTVPEPYEDCVALLARDGDRRMGWYSFFSAHRERLKSSNSSNGTSATAISDQSVRLVLRPFDRTIRGRLVDASQKGLSQVLVFVSDLSTKNELGVSTYGAYGGTGLPLPRILTDEQGRFELHVPGGTNVGAYTVGREWCQTHLTWADSVDDIGDQVLEQGGRLKGTVKNAGGIPIAGVKLSFRGVSLSGKLGSFGDTQTDAKGEFESIALLSDEYKVRVARSAIQPDLVPIKPVQVIVAAGEVTQAEVVVKEGAPLKGRCVEADSGRPLVDQGVRLTVKMTANPQSEIDFARVTKTKANGEFEFFVPRGIATLEIVDRTRESNPDAARIIEISEERAAPFVVLKLGSKLVARTRRGNTETITEERKDQAVVKQDKLVPKVEPVRPKSEVELTTPQKSKLGDYIVRTVFQGSKYVNETSLRKGPKFDQEFMAREVGKTVRLLIDVPGFTPVWTKEILIENKLQPIIVALETEEFVAVEGRVVDPDKQHLANARIRSRRIFHGTDSKFPWGPEAVTDAAGKFMLRHLRRGETFELVVDHVERVEMGQVTSAQYSIRDTKPITIPELLLSRPDQVVAGIVTDQDGIPIPDTTIKFEQHPPRETKTDGEGKFKLEGLPHGTLEFQLRAPDGSRSRDSVTSGTQDARFFVALRSLYNRAENKLPITLQLPDNAPPVKWSFYLINNDTNRVVTWATRESATLPKEDVDLGSFLRTKEVPHLSLQVFAADYAFPSANTLTVRPKIEPVTVELKPAPSPRLKIRVIDNRGQPVAGARLGETLFLTPKVSHSDYRYISNAPEPAPMTDEQGIYEYRQFPQGISLSIYTNAPGFAGAHTDRLTLDKDAELTLKLSPAKRIIIGRVLDPAGAPVPNFPVAIHDFSRPKTTTQPDGTFRIEGAPDGELIIQVGTYSDPRGNVQKFTEEEAKQPITIKTRRAT